MGCTHHWRLSAAGRSISETPAFLRWIREQRVSTSNQSCRKRPGDGDRDVDVEICAVERGSEEGLQRSNGIGGLFWTRSFNLGHTMASHLNRGRPSVPSRPGYVKSLMDILRELCLARAPLLSPEDKERIRTMTTNMPALADPVHFRCASPHFVRATCRDLSPAICKRIFMRANTPIVDDKIRVQ